MGHRHGAPRVRPPDGDQPRGHARPARRTRATGVRPVVREGRPLRGARARRCRVLAGRRRAPTATTRGRRAPLRGGPRDRRHRIGAGDRTRIGEVRAPRRADVARAHARPRRRGGRMNDFETRARAAAGPIHDAVGVPVGGRRADRPSRGPIRALLIAAVVVVVTAIVGTAVLTHDESGTAADVATFCAEVQQMATRPLDGERHPESLAFLRDAPEEIRPTALAILRSRTQRQSSASIEDSQRFLLWWQTRCFPNAAMPGAGPADRRDAPAPAPTGFEPCGVNNGGSIGTPEQLRDEYGTITIYGDRRRADPYAGR